MRCVRTRVLPDPAPAMTGTRLVFAAVSTVYLAGPFHFARHGGRPAYWAFVLGLAAGLPILWRFAHAGLDFRSYLGDYSLAGTPIEPVIVAG